MDWSELFDESNQPDFIKVSEFVSNELWQELNSFLTDTYNVLPKFTYSKCSMQRGWNLKYQKGGKSLCVLYPMNGYFIALVVIGQKEMVEAELLMRLCCDYTRNLFVHTKNSLGGKWLMINVTDRQILEDVKDLIKIRMKLK